MDEINCLDFAQRHMALHRQAMDAEELQDWNFQCKGVMPTGIRLFSQRFTASQVTCYWREVDRFPMPVFDRK